MSFRKFFSNILPEKFRWFVCSAIYVYTKNTNRKNYAKSSEHTELLGPLHLNPQLVEMDEHTRLQADIRMISYTGRLVVKKFTAIAADTLIVPGTHIPTVGMPQYLSTEHLNDKDGIIVVEEDCWIGARCILLSHCRIGRGAVVGAGSIVTKEIPPYAVVAGSPARIIATRFSIDQIIEHERILYPKEERLTRQRLEQLFMTHYQGLRSIGVTCDDEAFQRRLYEAKRKKGIAIYE